MYGMFGLPGRRRSTPFDPVCPRSAPFGEGLAEWSFCVFGPKCRAWRRFRRGGRGPPPGTGTEQQVIPRTPSQQLRVSFSGDLESAFPVISRSFDSCGSDTASRVPSALRRDFPIIAFARTPARPKPKCHFACARTDSGLSHGGLAQKPSNPIISR